jgi:hypothetical protein
MRKQALWSLCVAASSCACLWAANWPSVAGNPQRDGWAQQDTHLSPETASKIVLLYKHKFATVKAAGLNSITSTIDIAQVIGYTGFHEFLWTGSASGTTYQNDADLNYEFKTASSVPGKEPVKATAPTVLCPGGVTAAPIMAGLSSVSRFGGGGGGAFGRSGITWTIGEDGWVYSLRQQDSNNTWIPPQKLTPAGANVSALNISAKDTLIAATVNGCNGIANGLYASTFTYPTIENEPDKPFKTPPKWTTPISFLTNGEGFAGAGGTAIDLKGEFVFGTVPTGKGDVAGNYSDTLLKLDAATLTVKDYFTPASEPAFHPGDPGVTPAVFTEAGKEYILAGDRAGHIYLLDASAPGGSDHHTPLFATEALIKPGSGAGIFGHFATAVDEKTKTRWVFAAVHGPLTASFPGAKTITHGAIVAFKVDASSGRAKLVPAWTSDDMLAPAGPVVIGGLVAGLSSGLPSLNTPAGKIKTVAEVQKEAKPAKLTVFNAASGAEVFNSGMSMTSYSNTPLSAANGHIYVSTHDNTLLQFGIPEER